jgi:hypothetical protein
VIARAERPFLLPELDWEKKGFVPNVIFLEGAIVDMKSDGRLLLWRRRSCCRLGAVENHDPVSFVTNGAYS